MTELALKHQVAAVLHAAGEPLSLDNLMRLCDTNKSARQDVLTAIEALREEYADGPLSLVEVASGYRIQVRKAYAECVAKVENKKPPKASRALLETLALIVYRQPITRGEIEAVRGVAVSTNIIKTLHERGWIKVVGVREAPGKPSLYGSTKQFLDHFNLSNLSELPALDDIVDINTIESEYNEQLSLNVEGVLTEGSENEAGMPIEEHDASDQYDDDTVESSAETSASDDPVMAALQELDAIDDIADFTSFSAITGELEQTEEAVEAESVEEAAEAECAEETTH